MQIINRVDLKELHERVSIAELKKEVGILKETVDSINLKINTSYSVKKRA